MKSGIQIRTLPKFGAPIVILSLLSDAMMDFHLRDKSLLERHLIPARSVVLLEGNARYDYQHSIAPVKSERISVVFRQRLL